MEKFASVFKTCGFKKEAFYPCYGLAEATLFASGGEKSSPPVTISISRTHLNKGRAVRINSVSSDSQVLVSCGKAILEEELLIVDPNNGKPLPSCSVGEIWLRGPHVGLGYWNDPEKSEETFDGRFAGPGECGFLRTGDLGFIHDGDLYITGRMKDVIIINGRNHYPQDIEFTSSRSHPQLEPGRAAAFTIEAARIEQLVLVLELERKCQETDLSQLAKALRETVTREHDLHLCQVLLVAPNTIPRTTSGKIKRQLAEQLFLRAK